MPLLRATSTALAAWIRCSRRWRGLVLLLLGSLEITSSWAAESERDPAVLLRRADQAYQAARTHYRSNRVDAAAAWEFGRRCFDRAELVTQDKERQPFAEEGIEACRAAIKADPASAPACYYLALNLGQLAQSKRSLSALKWVREMEEWFLKARQLDAHFDFAGPDRSLGLLYLDAPGWPASIGNRKKALQHLRQSVELAPEYPENRLHLANALLKNRERTAAEAQLKHLDELWPDAQARWSGPDWAANWVVWERERRQLAGRLKEHPTPTPADP